MFNEELKIKIEQLEQELASREDEYVNAVRSHKDYNTLRHIRDCISSAKTELQSLNDTPKANTK